MTTTNRDTLLATPDVPWASEAIELVFTQESRSVANHSARSWIFARMLRDHLNLTNEVDETLLFTATLLHDTVCAATRANLFASKSTALTVPPNFSPPTASAPPRSTRCG